MGSDDLFKKRRKAKRISDLARKKANKSPYKRVLLVCEGTTTEIMYFQSLIDHLRLSTARIEVVPAPSSCPLSNVSHSRDRLESGDWDLVFCVFDKDQHSKYDQALELLKSSKEGVRAAYSVPCFEFWLLLHFEYTTRSFYGNPTLSAADCVITELKRYISNYRKADPTVFEKTCADLERAIGWSKSINAEALRNNSDDPSTYVGDVVKTLQDIKKQMES